jgi:hypothetical protein
LGTLLVVVGLLLAYQNAPFRMTSLWPFQPGMETAQMVRLLALLSLLYLGSIWGAFGWHAERSLRKASAA